MKSYLKKLVILGFLMCSTACLDPLVDDTINPDRIFGDPNVDSSNAPHIEDDDAFRAQAALFPTELPYRQGFAQGDKVWYWDVPDQAIDVIVDIYLVSKDDVLLEGPIIDVIPGDVGYSPIWRKVFLNTTATYNGEIIRSREAIDLALQLGILDQAQPSEQVVNCPVVSRNAVIALAKNSTKAADLITGWYRNRRVNLVSFSPPSLVPLELNRIPVFPLYIFQRINERIPIDEAVSGIDLNGDNALLSSNIVFAANVTERIDARYSPIWEPWLVRTSSTYPSIDTMDQAPGYTAETDFLDSMTWNIRESAKVGGGSDKSYIVSVKKLDGLVNCSIQKEKGKL